MKLGIAQIGLGRARVGFNSLPRMAMLVAVSLTGCKESLEAARVTGPGNNLDAVVMEGSAGATTGFIYSVCVVPKGDPCSDETSVAWLEEASRSNSAWGIDMVWKSKTQLEVRYLKAKEARVTRAKVPAASKVVVTLKDGAEDVNAPRGPMTGIPKV